MPAYYHKPTSFFVRIIGIIVMMLFIIAASGLSAVSAAYSNNGGPAQANSVHGQGDKSFDGKDQVPPSGSDKASSIASASFSFSCGTYDNAATISITGVLSPASGYAALRAWAVSSNATIYESYVNVGAPTYYALGDANGNFSINVSFPPQGPGQVIKARVYRALVNTFGSWDSSTYQEQSYTCTGTAPLTTTLTCHGLSITGYGYPYSGYAALRLWKGSQVLVYDSYVPGFQTYYAPIQADGSFSINATFPTQPVGTSLMARVYRTPSATLWSWDNGYYGDYSVNCQN